MAKTKSKAEKVRAYFRTHPNADPKKVEHKFGVTNSTVYTARKAIRAERADFCNGDLQGEEKENILAPRARKVNHDLVEDIKTIKNIGVDRVRAILELL